jgi:hypothetical protein
MTDHKSVGAALRVAFSKSLGDRGCQISAKKFDFSAIRRQRDVLLRKIGENLRCLVSGEQFQYTAAQIQGCLYPKTSSVNAGIYPDDIPEFIGGFVSPPPMIHPGSFIRQMNTLHVDHAVVADDSTMAKNLVWLETLLGLTSAERKLLTWSYSALRDESGVLQGVLAQIRCLGWADALGKLAILLDEPVVALGDSFFQPCRLRAMGLLDTDLAHEPSSIAECLVASQTLIDILETVYRSEAALLVDVVESPTSWRPMCEMLLSDAALRDWFGRDVAELLSAAMAHRMLQAIHISTAIGWLTGFHVPPQHCEPLAGHLDLARVERAVRRCFVADARRKATTTPLALMRALYTVAAAA